MSSEYGSKLANPAPLGLACFALTTLLLSLINAGLLPASGEGAVVVLALIFGGLGQLIAGVLEFRTGNTFGMTVFASFGSFWLWFGLMQVLAHAGLVDLKGAGTVIGAALLLWGVLAFGMTMASLRLNRVLSATLAVVVIALVLLGLASLLGQSALGTMGGWAGLLAGTMALYLSFAGLMSAAYGRSVLPVGEPG